MPQPPDAGLEIELVSLSQPLDEGDDDCRHVDLGRLELLLQQERQDHEIDGHGRTRELFRAVSFEEAGLGIAFRAKPALAEVADAELRHNALHALLWVQGLRREDWSAD